MSLTLLIPAAGAARRMRGGDKMLELVDAEPMLHRQARIARQICARVIVTLREPDLARRQVLAGLDLTVLPIPDADEGMAASIRAGAAMAPGALMILPGDMPEIEVADLRLMIDRFDQMPDVILRATSADGTPGHPVIFPAGLRAALQRLRGDTGARRVLAQHQADIQLIALPDQHALTDLDTPEEWQQWRNRQQS